MGILQADIQGVGRGGKEGGAGKEGKGSERK